MDNLRLLKKKKSRQEGSDKHGKTEGEERGAIERSKHCEKASNDKTKSNAEGRRLPSIPTETTIRR